MGSLHTGSVCLHSPMLIIGMRFLKQQQDPETKDGFAFHFTAKVANLTDVEL